MSHTFWKDGGLAGYLQVIVSVIALATGVAAYNSWRTQETAKRNAELAIQILRDTSAYSNCFKRARELGVAYDGEELSRERFIQLAKQAASQFAACNEQIGQLEIDEVLAKNVLTLSVANALGDIQLLHKTIELAHASAQLMAVSEELWRRQDKDVVHRRAVQVGLTFLTRLFDGPPQVTASINTDTPESQLAEYRSALEHELGPFLLLN